VLAVVVASAFGAIGLWLALRTGSAEAVQGLFPLLFVMFFLSSISLPRNLIAQDWFRTIADWNPVSYMVEGLRSLVITGWDTTALWKGFVIAGGIFVLAIFASSQALRTRMERT
jgi:ABC-2 type transport system permease protein